MSDDRNDRIRRRAYEIWEALGQPEGRQEEHWIQAEAEILADEQEGIASVPEGTQSTSGAPEGTHSTENVPEPQDKALKVA